MSRHVVLAGATGLIGGHLLQLLLDDPTVADVVALTRRPLAIPHPKLVPAVVDFTAFTEVALPPVDDFFCCLGTTMAKAGSRQAFRETDLGLPLAIAEMALAAGATRGFYVSSMGADPRSRMFYNRVKGELEAGLAALPFRTVIAFRPSLLAGDRMEYRAGERLALAALAPLGALIPAKYRPIDAQAVALAMLLASHGDAQGRFIVESDEIRRVAAGSNVQ